MLVQNSQQSTDSSDLIRIYLREIGRIPLLTPQQEISYGNLVQQMMSLLEAKRTLAVILRREPTLAKWAAQVQLSEVQLNETLLRGQQAKQKMILANLRLVVNVAKKYQYRGLELLDLIQEGTLGLTRAVEKFDPTRGYKFSTYAYWWIKQSITRAIATNSRTIRLPSHITEKLNKIKKIQHQVSQKLGRTPTINELATEMRLTPKQIRECLEHTRKSISLNQLVGECLDTELAELVEDMQECPEEFATQSALSDDLEQLMGDLLTWQ